jgi:hypothetical protein
VPRYARSGEALVVRDGKLFHVAAVSQSGNAMLDMMTVDMRDFPIACRRSSCESQTQAYDPVQEFQPCEGAVNMIVENIIVAAKQEPAIHPDQDLDPKRRRQQEREKENGRPNEG